jgi:SAM-dependent methyltransferase
MKWEDVMSAYIAYKVRKINATIHPKDVMYNTAVRKWLDYEYCGRSGVDVVSSMLTLAPTKEVNSILDYGCGHGRVGRFLRGMFPRAEITFAEVDETCTEFCAREFDGIALNVPKDFKEVRFERTYDLIWLGSVFTHIDYERMQELFDVLFNALNPNGLLVATFRGNKMYERYLQVPEMRERDADLIADYERERIAYKRYAGWEDDWGLSLVHPAKLIEIGHRHPSARLVSYSEVTWSDAHDVMAWTNTTPGTVIGPSGSVKQPA